MPLYSLKEYQGARIGVWKVSETLSDLSHLHPEGEALLNEASSRLKNESRRLEWLAVRVLFHHLLREMDERIVYLANGKPYLESNRYQISISHTQGYVAVILHPERIVGIDIERIGDRVRKVVSRFISPDEKTAIHDDSVLPLLLHWCAKETAYKMMNIAEVDFLNHLHVMNFRYPTVLDFQIKETRTPEQKVFQLCGCLDPDYVMTWSVFS